MGDYIKKTAYLFATDAGWGGGSLPTHDEREGSHLLLGHDLSHLLQECGQPLYAMVEVVRLPLCLEEESLRYGEALPVVVPEEYGGSIAVHVQASVVPHDAEVLVVFPVVGQVHDAPLGNHQPLGALVPSGGVSRQEYPFVLSQQEMFLKLPLHLVGDVQHETVLSVV